MKKMTFLACAAMLTSAVAITGCNNNDKNGANQAPECVKTEFAISLPNQLKSTPKKMPSATAQVGGATQFQGITDIFLVPFDKQGEILGTDKRLGANIELSGDVAQADIDKPSSAKVYSDVSIPLSTASFLFYAKSAATGTKFEVGSLLPANMTDNYPGSFTFSLEQIQSDAGALTGTTVSGGKLLQYLTNVAIATDGASKAWYAYTDADNAALKAMFDTYSSMHGLSSFEVERVLTDLNKSLKPLDDGVNNLPHAIRAAIADATYATVNASDEVELIAAWDNFPGEYNLPVGAIDIRWDGSAHKFVVGNYSNMASPDKYVYPAQLWYYVNSQIKTSNTSKQTMYDNVNDWTAILNAHTDAISVNSLTRAVAIEDAVQYAVARLDVQARLKAESLEDNSLTAEGARTDVLCSAGFPITAVLVGGQQQVKFDFTTNGGTEYTIYDNIMASTRETTPADMVASYSTTTYSAMNHTLVLENGTNDVMIALEMVNNTGVDFYGAAAQLIPKGGKFYVVAKLTAADATETGGHVFKQDFVTTAKLTLKDLKSAYNTIPDLRTPELELGFSVDLTWQNGHSYEIEF